jgi:hypothetical protein
MLFRLWNPGSGDHFYTTSATERDSAAAGGYAKEGTACHVFSASAASRIPMHRLFKKFGARLRLHVKIVQNYVSEGTACQVFSNAAAGRVPLHRLFNASNGDHFYTTSDAERDNAIAKFGYVSENEACFVPAAAAAGTTALHRLLNNTNGDHFYTTSIAERDNAIAQFGYHSEGIACQVRTSPATGTTPLFRLWNASNGDHFYTTSTTERNAAIQNLGPSVPISTMLASMRQVYDTVGIEVVLASTQNISSPNEVDCDVGSCSGSSTTGEQDTLFANRDNVLTGDVVVYFVRTTVPAFNGCATHPGNRPGAVVAAGASRWTMGHEVGHVLGLSHVNDNDRLMTGNGTANITNPPPDLVSSEAATMDASVLTTDI